MVSDFLKRAADKLGYRREKYVEHNVPTTFDNIMVLPFFGDMRSEFILSTLLLHKVKQLYSSKYFILCSYPGRAGMYPYVDEYWGIQDSSIVGNLLSNAVGFGNNDVDFLLFKERQLNGYFENVLDIENMSKYYHNGFKKQFFDDFKWIVYNLPALPSSKVEFNRLLANRFGHKVMVYPCKVVRSWNRGRMITVETNKSFWFDLLKALCNNNLIPVLYLDAGAYDISFEGAERCYEANVLELCGAMRTVGCVLDVFSGISRFAGLARTPFVSCVERHLYNEVREYEIDDLCNGDIPYRYIFSFPTIINGGNWSELVSSIVSKLKNFIPDLNRDVLPSTADKSTVVPYSLVKERKRKRIGSKFINVKHCEI